MAAAPQRLGRLAALVLAAAAIASLLPEGALAASRVCRQLEAELASGGGGPSAAQLRKQDASIARQREQLQLAKRQSRRAGCGFRLFGGGSSSCGAINLKIDKMERNLDAANITLTAVKEMMDALHVGPILLGTEKPAHILTPSVTSRGVVNMTALAVAEGAHRTQELAET